MKNLKSLRIESFTSNNKMVVAFYPILIIPTARIFQINSI